MARIFTTSFEFNHQRYDAIVTLTSAEGKTVFNVKLLDLDLQAFLPDGEVRYEGTNGFAQLESLNNTVAQSIMRKLEAAIEQHLVTR